MKATRASGAVAVGGRWLVIFVVLTYAVTWPAPWIGARWPLLGEVAEAGAGIVAIGLTAMLAGWAGVRALLGGLGRWRVHVGWYVAAVGLPILFALAVLSTYVAQMGTWLTPEWERLAGLWGRAGLIFWVGLAAVEVGWRGFALPRLMARFSPVVAGVIMGLLILGRFLPQIVLPGGPMYGQAWGAIILLAVGQTVLATWLFNRSGGSLVITMLFYAAATVSVIFNAGMIPQVQQSWMGTFTAGAALLVYWLEGAELGRKGARRKGVAVLGRERVAGLGLPLYVGLAYVITWPALLVAPRSPLAVGVAGFGPALAALVVIAATEGGTGVKQWLGRLAIWRVGWRWYAVALGLPVVVALLAVGLNRLLGGMQIDVERMIIWWVLALNTGLIFGEELGWRGFLLPRLLAGRSALAASLIVGVVWVGWHIPTFFVPGLAQYGHSFVAFAWHLLAQSVLFTWLYHRTRGSVLLAALLHASFNFSVIFYAGAHPRQQLWFSAAAATVAAAVVLWRSGPELGRPVVGKRRRRES